VVLLIALLQGSLYIVLVPPWQHYDEPTHFEYAWLVANDRWLPEMSDAQPAIRREIQASMIEHAFFRNLYRPPAFSDADLPWLGFTQLVHPPIYYLIVGTVLLPFRQLDVVSQLYIARSVSLLLMLGVVAVAFAIVRELTPADHWLRWAVPLALIALPPAVDVMTAVNNDVGATLVFSLVVWAAVRMIRRGVTFWRLVWVFGCGMLAVQTKNTAAFALPFALLATLIAFWHQRRWAWRWLVVVCAGLVSGVVLVLFSWGDAQFWYRPEYRPQQYAPNRALVAEAPHGQAALRLEAAPGSPSGQVLHPLSNLETARIAGKTITIGGWIWANQPVSSATLGIGVGRNTSNLPLLFAQPITVTTTPTFVALQYQVPAEAITVRYELDIGQPTAEQGPITVYLDGAILAVGAYPVQVVPTFDNSNAASGMWDTQPFRNVLRNPSAEATWPYLKPWIDEQITNYAKRSPAQALAALFDLERIFPILRDALIVDFLRTLVGGFGWGQITFAGTWWITLVQVWLVACAVGGLRWLFRRETPADLRLVGLFLALIITVTWLNTLLRPLPLLHGLYVYPVARYALPAIVPVLLGVVAGWWWLWPARMRRFALLGGVGMLLFLNLASFVLITSYFRLPS
jgi:hypothetical protein